MPLGNAHSTTYQLVVTALALLLFGLIATAQEGVATIRAVDDSGNPVADAEVLWVPYKDGLRTEFPGPDERGVTDEDGQVTIDFTQHPDYDLNNFSVRVVAGDGRVGYQRVYPKRDAAEPVTIEVARRAAVRGTVRDGQQGPVEGVVVGSRWFPITTTDAQGRFEIFGDGNGTNSLSFFKEGYAWTTHSFPQPEMELVLQRGHPVTFALLNEDGEPLPGARLRYADCEAFADESGRVATLPLPPGRKFYAQAWHREGDARYVFEGGRFEVGQSAPQVEEITLQRRDPQRPETVVISGRVVMAGSGEPVRSRIVMANQLHDFDYHADLEDNTQDDGEFLIENVYKGRHYIQARPNDPNLYPVDGIVEADTSNGSVEDLVLTVDKGCAIRGQVITPDGARIDQMWVTLHQANQPTINYLARGRGNFAFNNLPPQPSTVRLSAGKAQLEVSLPPAGEMLTDVDLRLPGLADKAFVTGSVVDSQGEPMGGINMTFRIHKEGGETGFAHAETDDAGQFRVETEELGRIEMENASVMRSFVLGEYEERTGFRCEIVEAFKPFQLEGGQTYDDKRVVLARPEINVISGNITDDAGNAIKPEVNILTADDSHDRPRGETMPGGFLYHSLPDEPFALEFTLENYQARILQSGRDFAVGDRQIEVVMNQGPFADEPHIWTQITGAPWTEDAVNAALQSEYIRRKFDRYRQLASGEEERQQQARPQQPTAPSSLRVHVTDANGKAIKRIVVQSAESLNGQPMAGPTRVEDARPSSSSAAEILTSEDGYYDIPNGNLFWAENTCRRLVHVGPNETVEEPLQLTLYPAHTLTIRIENREGEPVPDVGIAPAQTVYQYVSMGNYGLPKTNRDGEVVLQHLPPGNYAFALLPEQRPHQPDRFVYATLPPGEDVVVEGLIGPYSEGSGDALLEAFKEKLQNPGMRDIEAAWNEEPADARRKMADAARDRLSEMTVVHNRDPYWLAQVVALAGEKSAVEPLKRLFVNPWQSLLGHPEKEIPFAIADLGGNDVLPFLRDAATDQSLSPTQRMLALIAMNRIGTKESLDAWQELRDAAHAKEGAPQPQAEYTHAERMAEALRFTLHLIPGTQGMPEPHLHSARVSDDYTTGYLTAGSIMHGSTEYVLRRYGDEWVVVDIGPTAIA